MPVRASTQTVGLVDFLSLIHGSGHAGTLKVQAGEQETRLHFYKGQIFLPTGGSRGAYRIGALLVRAGKLSGKDLLRALQIQKQEGHRERLGDLLVRHRLVTREDLDQVIRNQFEEEICDLLFSDAFWEWKKDVLPAGFADARGHILALGFDTRSILMEASRRQDEWRRIQSMIPSTRSIYRVAVLPSGTWHVDPSGKVSSEVRESTSQDAEAEVVRRWKETTAVFEQNPFDGVRSVEEIVSASGVPRFVAMGVVANLRQEGFIRELAAQEVEAAAVTQLRAGRRKAAFKLYEWANEADRLRPSGVRLDKAFLRPEYLQGMAFATRTSSVRALQVLSRLLRRDAPFRFRTREAESAVEVFCTQSSLRLHLVGPRRTHSTARYLRRRNAITGDQLERARQIAAAEDRKLDRVLLEDGFVGKDVWVRAVKDKIVSGMFSVFGWGEPDLEVSGGEASAPAPSDVAGLVCEIPLGTSLKESLRRDLLRWKVLLQEIPTPDVLFLCTQPTPEGKPRRAQDLFDGRRAIRDLISLARVAPLELMRFVYDCIKTGRIRRLTDREHYERLEQCRQAGRLDDAITLCKSAMAFGYAPKLYGERLRELRGLQEKKGPSTEARPLLQGDAGSLGLAELLQLLHQGKCSGTLRIGDGPDREKVLYLDQGTLYVLKVEASHADREVWDLIMGDDTKSALDLSGILNRRGLVAEEEVGAAELESIKQDIFECFLWEGATYEFVQNLLPPELRDDSQRATKLALRTDRLLIEAMSRLAEWDELKKVVKGERAVFRYASPSAQLEAIQTEGIGAVAYLFDGKHTLGEVLRISSEPRLRIYRVVKDLVESGKLVLAELKKDGTRKARRPPAPLASGRIPRIQPDSDRYEMPLVNSDEGSDDPDDAPAGPRRVPAPSRTPITGKHARPPVPAAETGHDDIDTADSMVDELDVVPDDDD